MKAEHIIDILDRVKDLAFDLEGDVNALCDDDIKLRLVKIRAYITGLQAAIDAIEG